MLHETGGKYDAGKHPRDAKGHWTHSGQGVAPGDGHTGPKKGSDGEWEHHQHLWDINDKSTHGKLKREALLNFMKEHNNIVRDKKSSEEALRAGDKAKSNYHLKQMEKHKNNQVHWIKQAVSLGYPPDSKQTSDHMHQALRDERNGPDHSNWAMHTVLTQAANAAHGIGDHRLLHTSDGEGVEQFGPPKKSKSAPLKTAKPKPRKDYSKDHEIDKHISNASHALMKWNKADADYEDAKKRKDKHGMKTALDAYVRHEAEFHKHSARAAKAGYEPDHGRNTDHLNKAIDNYYKKKDTNSHFNMLHEYLNQAAIKHWRQNRTKRS